MNGEKLAMEGSDVNRRNFLQAVGIGAGVAGLAGTSGFASAADDQMIEEVEPLSEDEAVHQFELAMNFDHVQEVTAFMGEGSLEMVSDRVWAGRIYTTDEELDARRPVVVSIPFKGDPDHDEGGFFWELLFDNDDGDRIAAGGFGITVERVGDQDYHKVYAHEDEEPAVIESEPLEDEEPEVVTQDLSCWVCERAVSAACRNGIFTSFHGLCTRVCSWFASDDTCEDACDLLAAFSEWFVCEHLGAEDACELFRLC